MPASKEAAGAQPDELLAEVESFLASCRRPAAIETGIEPIPVETGSYQISMGRGGVLLEVWSRERTLARRIVGLKSRSAARLELVIERLGGKTAAFRLVDLEDSRSRPSLLKAGREVLLDRFANWISRQFPGWRVETLTTGRILRIRFRRPTPGHWLRVGDADGRRWPRRAMRRIRTGR